MRRATSLVAAAAMLAACQETQSPLAPSGPPASSALSAAVIHSRDRQLITNDLVVSNPCSGEDILLHLNQLFTIHEVSVEGKFFHGHLTFNDRGTRGEGLTSGAVYRQTGAEQEFLHLKGLLGVKHRIEVTLNLIGKGSAPNFLAHEIFVATVSPAGVVTVQFDKVHEVCRG